MRQRNTSRKNYLSEAGGWVAHRHEMTTSPAWRKRPKALAKMLERLEIEHLGHAGKENGHLMVSYDQFQAFGVSRKDIRPMLRLGEALGLLETIQTENWAGDVRAPNRYRLTYLPEKGKKAPTDEWAFLGDAQVDAILHAARSAHKHSVATSQQRESA